MHLTKNTFPVLSVLPLRAVVVFLSACLVWVGFSLATAQAETRTLRMYYGHSKESATITFKKNGKYIKSGLRKANRFLRDWRRKEPTKMDPALLDLVWEVYKASGSRKPIQVISGYRSPKTNRMLRRRGRGVAKTSQHTRGKALDFYLSDVSVSKLRALGLKAHRGGVGYYRGSFVHLDTGRVRHWPRMSRKQLAKVFPRGKTIHVPSDGRPLKGYKVAMANLKKGLNADGRRRNTTVRRTLLAGILNRSGSSREEDEASQSVRRTPRKKPAPKPKATKVVAAVAPKPKAVKGPDPFSQDSSAVSRAEAIRRKQEEEQVVALLRVPVPKKRPNARSVTQLALAAESALRPAENVLAPVRATELALASPESLTPSSVENALRPRVDIPSVAPAVAQAVTPTPTRALTPALTPTVVDAPTAAPAVNPQSNFTAQAEPQIQLASLPVAADRVGENDVNGLKTRIQAALSRNREVPAESKPENQQLLAALSRLPVPKYAVQRPAVVDENAVPVPSLFQRPDAAQSQQASVEDKADSSVSTAKVEFKPELKLGDLDGRSVKTWAVAVSTRVGSSAELQAPIYKQGTRRAAPSSVYSQGFAFNRAPLRADRFSGRSLTRVAFAHFGSKNQ